MQIERPRRAAAGGRLLSAAFFLLYIYNIRCQRYLHTIFKNIDLKNSTFFIQSCSALFLLQTVHTLGTVHRRCDRCIWWIDNTFLELVCRDYWFGDADCRTKKKSGRAGLWHGFVKRVIVKSAYYSTNLHVVANFHICFWEPVWYAANVRSLDEHVLLIPYVAVTK